MASVESALDQMLRDGMPAMPAEHPRFNSKRIVRYGPKLRAWYRLNEHVGRNGRTYISGVYGYWGLLPEGGVRIAADFAGLEPDEVEAIRAAESAIEARELAKREARAKFATQRARDQYAKASSDESSLFLRRKRVEPEKRSGLKFAEDGTLLVPMLRYDEITGQGKPRLVGLQKIAPDGSRRVNRGAARTGAAFRLGRAPKNGDPILIVEDIETGLTVRKATELMAVVFVAFDCEVGFLAVAKILRHLYPASPVLLCADNDMLSICVRHRHEGAEFPKLHDASRPEWCRCNTGVSFANVAATAIGNATVIWPADVGSFNDGYVELVELRADGLEPIREAIVTGLGRLRAMLPAPPGAAKAEKKPKKPPPEMPEEFWPRFLRRYTLIYPTETAYDAEYGEIVKCSGMRTMWGDFIFEQWRSHDKRRTVTARDVVFDPSEQCDPERSVNLFRGWTFKPNPKASCQRLRELLQYLCGEEGRDIAPITDWVERWIAYPLQHPGAKMRTAVVMHGPEGTGKNMFWGAVSSIYGPYGGLINQFQLQSQFNDWASRKMFIVANEVVTRMEIKHLVGYLKNLVTEPRIPIETKGMPVREEDNRMQLVFLSNELRPLHVSPLDRRYTIIRTPGMRGKDYYAEVEAEIQADGAAALYQYFMELDLGDFNEHAKPPETQAKFNLIELGLTPGQLFQQELHEGRLEPLTYGPARVVDVYEGFKIFCARIGEKNPAKLPQFSHEFMQMNGVTRRQGVRLPDPRRPSDWAKPSSAWKQTSVFLMGKRPDDESEESWLKKNVGVWYDNLKEFAGSGHGVISGDDEAAAEARRSAEQAGRPGGAGDPAL